MVSINVKFDTAHADNDGCPMRRVLLMFYLAIPAFAGGANSAYAQVENRPDKVYEVLPGDVLQVSVWKEPDLQLEVLVRPDGAFSFPLAGDISTKGLSVVELQSELTKRLSQYISSPVVTVSVAEVLGNKIYVIGQVNKPGDFVVNPQVDVMQALSMAGGLTAFADTNDIKILRRTGDRQIAISFKYNEVLKGKDLNQNIVLQSGDIVVVP
jgi:polysaccharide export outer membrane protein